MCVETTYFKLIGLISYTGGGDGGLRGLSHSSINGAC